MSLEYCAAAATAQRQSAIEKSQYLFTVVGFCQHRENFGRHFGFACLLIVVVLLLAVVLFPRFAFCLVSQTWCIKFDSVVVRLSRIASSVSGILIPVFCWL